MKTNEIEATTAVEAQSSVGVIQSPKDPKKTKVAKTTANPAAEKAKSGSKAKPAKKGAGSSQNSRKAAKAPRAASQESAGPRDGSKTAQVVALIQRKSGATLAEIMEKTAWQKHTVRGFMAGSMKKAGYRVESFKPEGGERTYRIN